MTSRVLAQNVKIVRGKTLVETAASGVSAYPASGSFIDVSGFEYVHVLVHCGTIHASDTPVLAPKCAEAANGTLDVIDSTLAHTVDVTNDDGRIIVWTIAVDKLPADHHFMALAASGTLTNGSYFDVIFLLDGARNRPPTQPATVPSANVYSWV